MIVQRSRAPERAMVFDVKQFKSLEGFLESGPQFVLQLYVLLHQELEEGTKNTNYRFTNLTKYYLDLRILKCKKNL